MAKLSSGDRTRLHHQVRHRIENMLIRGGRRKGDAIPTYRELSDRLQVSLVTVQRAMDELVKDGIVRGWPGRGTFLQKDLVTGERKLTQLGLIFYGSRQLFFGSPWLMEIFQGIMYESESRGVDVRIFSIKNEGRIRPVDIEESGVDGLLLLGVANNEYLAEVARETLPLVVVDYRTDKVPADYVVVANESAAQRAVEHLHSLGHRHMVYIDGYSTDTTLGLEKDPVIETSDVVERREGYLKAMAMLGLLKQATVYPIGSDPGKSVAAAAEAIVAGNPRPTAVVTYDTGTARNLMRQLEARGLRVPQDISLAAAAGSSDGQAGSLSLTYNRVRFVEMGKQAVERLQRRFNLNRPTQPETAFIESDFVLGNTSAAPLNEKN